MGEKSNPASEAYRDVMQRPVDKWVSSQEMIESIIYPLNERMSIRFPEMAMLLSHKNTNKTGTALLWNAICKDKFAYSFQRNWMAHKKPETNDKTKKSKNVDILENEEIIRKYSAQYGYDYESVKEAIKCYPDDMRVELIDFEDDFLKV